MLSALVVLLSFDSCVLFVDKVGQAFFLQLPLLDFTCPKRFCEEKLMLSPCPTPMKKVQGFADQIVEFCQKNQEKDLVTAYTTSCKCICSFTIYMHGRKFWWRLFYADLSCAEAPSTIEGPPLRFPIFFISSFFIIVNYCYFILISSCFVFSFLYLRF